MTQTTFEPTDWDGFGAASLLAAPLERDDDTYNHVIALIPLAQLQIDLDQPRRFLGRHRNTDALTTPQALLRSLISYAGANEPDATALIADIQSLADNIAQHGLKYPLHVRADRSGAYTIIDGERRFWALHWLAFQCETPLAAYVPCIVHPTGASREEIEATQWSVNMQRSDLPIVDIADWVTKHFDSALEIAQDDSESGTSPEQVAAQHTIDTLYARSGRRITQRTLWAYRQISAGLSIDVKHLASAHNIGINALVRVVRVKGAERQLRALKSELGLEPQAERDNIGGRPNVIDRCGNLIEKAALAFDKLNERSLARLPPEKAAEAISRIAAHHERLREHISRLQKRYQTP